MPTPPRNPFAPEDAVVAQKRRRAHKAKDDTSASAGPWWTFLAWLLTLVFFAPVAWMVLTSLHQESTPRPTRRRSSRR